MEGSVGTAVGGERAEAREGVCERGGAGSERIREGDVFDLKVVGCARFKKLSPGKRSKAQKLSSLLRLAACVERQRRLKIAARGPRA